MLLLWVEAVAASYAASTWMTYRQAQALGGQVRKGERGCPMVYFGTATRRGGGQEDQPDRHGDGTREKS